MLDKTSLHSLAEERLKDARALLDKERYDGAVYIGGYAVELVLKARICDTLNVDEYPVKLPGFKIHDLDTLLLLSGREKTIRNDHETVWSLATDKWGPHLRYRTINTISSKQAQDMIQAISNLLPLL